MIRMVNYVSTILEKRVLQLFKNPSGLLSGYIFATLRRLRGSSRLKNF
jgi:hypothetical protein